MRTNCVDIRKRASENIIVSRDWRKGRSDAPNFPPRETRIPVKTNMRTTIETITPKLARVYFDRRAPNRPINNRAVMRYSQAMKDGAWETTHEGIAFNENNMLIDGQHRLLAVIDSNVTITIQVTRYSERAPMAVMNCGVARNQGDRMQLAGVIPDHGRAYTAIISAMILAEHGAEKRQQMQPHVVFRIYEQEKNNIGKIIDILGFSKKHSAIMVAGLSYCYVFAPTQIESLTVFLRDRHGYAKGGAAHAFVSAIADRKLQMDSAQHRIESMAKILWLIRQHIENKPVERIKTTASIFEWAKRQRQLAGVPTIAETLG